MKQDMKRPVIIDVNAANAGQTGFFCFMSKRKNPGYGKKLLWLKQRFAEGLHLRLLQLPQRGFIEYVPGEFAWRPLSAKGYMVIHCLWVVGKSKGRGLASVLLRECIADAKKARMTGVAMVVSGGSYMGWKGFLARHGFVSVDTAPPSYELMALRFGDSPWPKFSGGWEKKARACGKGLTIFRTDQCPYFDDATAMLLATARDRGVTAKVIELRTAKDVRGLAPSPYGVYSVVIDGDVVPSHYQAKQALLTYRK
jgi:hypothetical protein